MRRLGTFAVIASCALRANSPESLEFFEKKIRPVLSVRCQVCHSAKSQPPQGGLLLDTAAGMRKGGASGKPAVVPGDPSASAIIAALRYEGPVKMPPGKPLAEGVIADFEAWIKMGAPDPRESKSTQAVAPYDFDKARQRWAFRPVEDPAPPAVKDTLWSQSPIDRFLKAAMDGKGLTPVGLASRRALIRRATFDLTGLPPTPEDVGAFLRDRSPDAYEKLIDRLLASPQYGEKWGRHWMDVVRYADTAGCNSDFPVPDLYRYRNWIIRAFNEDKPYNEFLAEQLAGDLLPPKNDEDRQSKIVATSYVALARRFASSKGEHHLTLDDTVDNVGKAMLGLSVSCARCHDHKFDPIPQRDYYGLYGIFQSTSYAFPGVETFPRPHDFIALGGPDQQKKLTEWENSIIRIQDEIRELRFGKKRNEPGAREQAKKLEAESLAIEINNPNVPRAYAVKEGKAGNAKVQYKGDPKKLGDEVPRGFLTVLGGQRLPDGSAGSGRLELAKWVTDPKNPLTYRVMVNRIWQGHFGKGIVATPNDFGVRGEGPTHPDLLDYLASRFAESGYSVKRMHRLLMLSRAYRLASDHSASNALKDPKNSYLWRFDRRRLEAEEVRDSMLAVSGQLDQAPGGAHPFPPVHEWKYTQHKQFFAVYETNKRSVYMMQQRLRKNPMMELFDSADPNASTGQRGSNVTALQALALMNSEFVHNQADALAVRIGMAVSDAAGRVQFAYNLALGRPATPTEVQQGVHYIARAQAAMKTSGLNLEKQPRAALGSYLRTLLASDEFVFVD
jgi:hypothetical protein